MERHLYISYPNIVNMKRGVRIVLCGYAKPVPEGFRPWEDVVYDRTRTALELAEFLSGRGFEVDITIAGGLKHEGVLETAAFYEYAREAFPGLENYTINFETRGTTTEESTAAALRGGKDKQAVFFVSNPDHLPRVLRDAAYSGVPEGVIVGGVASQEPYSLSGTQPIITEPPSYLRDALENALRVPPQNQELVKKAIRRIIEENIE